MFEIGIPEIIKSCPNHYNRDESSNSQSGSVTVKHLKIWVSLQALGDRFIKFPKGKKTELFHKLLMRS